MTKGGATECAPYGQIYNDGTIGSYDTTAPTSTASSSGTVGANGWYRSSVQITLNASDNSGGSGVQLRQYRIGSGTWQTYNSPFTVSANGTTTVSYRAQDNAGNWETAKTLTLKVDSLAPTQPSIATSGCINANNIWQNTCNDANFTWSGASDATSGVDSYQYYWGTNPAGTSNTTAATTSFNPPAVESDSYYLRLRTKDKAGNWSSWQTRFTLRFDDIAPSGSFTFRHGQISDSLHPVLDLNGQDTPSGVSSIQLSHDGSTWAGEESYAEAIQAELLSNDEAWQTLYLRFIDEAGNISPVYNQQTCLDLTPTPASSSEHLLWSGGQVAGAGQLQSSKHTLFQSVAQPTDHELSNSSYRLQSGFQSWQGQFNVDLFQRQGCVAEILGSGPVSVFTVYLPMLLK